MDAKAQHLRERTLNQSSDLPRSAECEWLHWPILRRWLSTPSDVEPPTRAADQPLGVLPLAV